MRKTGIIGGGHRDGKMISGKNYLKRKKSGGMMSMLIAGGSAGLNKARPYLNYYAKAGTHNVINYLPKMTKYSPARERSYFDVNDKDNFMIRYLKGLGKRTVAPYISDDKKGRRYRSWLKSKVNQGIDSFI